ncbi:MAG: hypothetical protein DRJ01_16255 [Bacteroidetes bacterium]|nr:MAG: hypothetical protein DRJ01_16255 [Bacteroidota bacterium]
MIKKIFAFLLISTVVFTACKKDEDNNLSTQESKIVLTEAGNDINTDLTEITNSDGAKSIIDIFNIININDPFTGTQKSVKITKRHFPYLSKLIYIPKIERKSGSFGDENFDFASNVGTYTWNAQYQNWDIQHGTPSDKIIINFPTQESTTNNAVLTINSYTEQQFTDDSDTWYQPTHVNANLYVNQIKYVDVDFDAAYNSDGDPTSITGTLFLKPFTLTVSVEKSNTKITERITLKKDNDTIIDINLIVSFSDVTLEDVTEIEGYIQIGHIKLKGEVNVVALDSLQAAPTVEQLNENINLSLYTDTDKKIGDLEFITALNGEIDLQIVFNDGTTELASHYFQALIESFKAFFGNNV